MYVFPIVKGQEVSGSTIVEDADITFEVTIILGEIEKPANQIAAEKLSPKMTSKLSGTKTGFSWGKPKV